jgi:predicted transcriptional regulator
LEHGASVHLFMRDGYLHALEVATYGEEIWPETDKDFVVGEV